MTPFDAHPAAHERIPSVVDRLLPLTMALDDGADAMIGSNGPKALFAGPHRTPDEARAARECFSPIAKPRDPL